ncbi:efflux RND transporter periplasmic adaptor subunit [Sphingomonas sp. LaA6.9]|uniref:efflux RND transporter periplasmic adaptor subunit n=1 Tax=Sphingomonas sp. LaA6.9 TaxID=2919914 RepID=UPI001F5006F2|nr:efflux RND transporter periplasmic adaptor subunit [Sphingomonas sp. LaA6.9]MCJ8156242.1 efflux RND transporter periplasmic adaptor subunit [Sphingomonas sp. LaA6.9]
MGLVSISTDSSMGAVSGGAMDRVVEKRTISRRVKIGLGAAALLGLAGGFYAFAPDGASQTVAADRVTISTVSQGRFEDFLPMRASVTPLVTVYLDAIEGGRVEEVLVEDGATVEKGQLLAVLSNAELQLSVLARQTEVTQQLNSMRSQELALAQNRLQNERSLLEAELAMKKAERQYQREAPLAAKGFVAGKTFSDTRDSYAYERDRRAVLQRAQSTDERLQSSQLAQLRASSQSLQSSLELARANLDALNLRAPVSGTLSAFSIQVGQSMARGERLGQIDSPGRNKLVAGVDEFYLARVRPGQQATVDWNGKSYRLRVTKIYPTVKNGQFEVDLQFVGDEPPQLQRGQTLQPKLTLGDPAPARLIPNGSFYNDTGGSWVFVVTPDGSEAVKRQVRLGRRNADFIEVLDGLDPGEKVLTSPYTGFADKDRLDLARK